jgi:opacity protein-like surface antigen
MRMGVVAAAVVCLLLIPQKASAQSIDWSMTNLELMAGYNHTTGDFGLNGFDLGAAFNFSPKIQIAANYDGGWHNGVVGTFQTTPIGQVSTTNHFQDLMFGPRYFFAPKLIKAHRVNPFAEVQFGWAHLGTSLSIPATGFNASTSDSAFAWLAGGGLDYMIADHFALRGDLDFDRTHFASAGQSRLRLVIGVNYTFASRER